MCERSLSGAGVTCSLHQGLGVVFVINLGGSLANNTPAPAVGSSAAPTAAPVRTGGDAAATAGSSVPIVRQATPLQINPPTPAPAPAPAPTPAPAPAPAPAPTPAPALAEVAETQDAPPPVAPEQVDTATVPPPVAAVPEDTSSQVTAPAGPAPAPTTYEDLHRLVPVSILMQLTNLPTK